MKKIIIVLFFMFIGLLAYGQSAQTYNLVKTHCDQINKEVTFLGNIIWGIIQYYNPEMKTDKVTREIASNGRRIGLCQTHEDIVKVYYGQMNSTDVLGSILIAKTYLLSTQKRGNPATFGIFWLLHGLNTPNMQAVYDIWIKDEYPKILELANEFEGWGL